MNPHPSYYDDADDLTPQPPLHFHRLPAGHGPKTETQFVKAQGQYDELGRSVQDGFGAEVGLGGVGGKGKGKERDPGALDFWRGLELGKGGSAVEGESSTTTIGVPIPMDPAAVPTGSVPSKIMSVSSSSAGRNRERSQPNPTPLLVPRSQWFIRRALAAKALTKPPASSLPSSDVSTSATPEPDPPTASSSSTSIASLLDLPPPSEAATYKPPNHYHIKPNNIGWKLLEKGGWNEAGGLGKPVGWEEEVERRKREGEVKMEETEIETGAGDKGKDEEDGMIDLTLDDSDDDSVTNLNPLADISSEPPRFGDQILHQASLEASLASGTRPLIGPGRTAPIATYLKTDLSGIGHRPIKTYSTLTAARVVKVGEGPRKRVTHSVEEVRAMARGKMGRGMSGEEGEWRRRGRAKREMKRDREQTQRLRALMFD